MIQSFVTSLIAAWQSLQLSVDRLRKHEQRAREEYFQAVRQRAAVASQAGDPSTLVTDQLELAPDSRERLRTNFENIRVILAELLAEWGSIPRALRQDLAN